MAPTAPKTKTQKLQDKKSNAVRALKSQEEKVKSLKTNASADEANTRLVAIESAYEKFKNVSNLLEDCDDYVEADEDENETIFELYVGMTTKLKALTKENDTSVQLNSTSIAPRNDQDVKLPRINIPTFDGKYEEWTAFYDSFHSLIDQSSMSDVAKFHQLRNYVKGSAYRLISKLPVTEANYKTAWQSLQARFHNKRAIVNSTLKQLYMLEKPTKCTADNMRSLIDTTMETIQTIESLDVSVEDWDPWVVFHIETKMSDETKKEWETHLNGKTEIPSFERLMKFLETRHRILEANEATDISEQKKVKIANINTQNSRKRDECEICKEKHYIFFCPMFDGWSIYERRKFIRDNKRCIKCLNKHDGQCRSKYNCKNCNGNNHNTKLCENTQIATSSANHNPIVGMMKTGKKMLATAIVKVKDKFGANHLQRVFIDGGSEGIVITERAAQRLCLPRKIEQIALTGIDDVPLGTAKKSVQLEVESNVDGSFKIGIEALVVRSILKTNEIKKEQAKKWKHLDNLELADPNYLESSEVDLLFGVDIFALILTEGLKKGEIFEPIAHNSHLGWVVFGALSTEENAGIRINQLTMKPSITDELRNFWENEQVESKNILSEEQQKCVEHFEKTYTRDENGAFTVSLPFTIDRNDPDFLGSSKEMAMRRFFQVEKRFKRDEMFKKRYHEDIQNYIDAGHMTLCGSSDGYFLPHHAVVREESTTTKQRTVYDGSAKTTNGYSLNDRLLNGPTIQPELFDTFIRWRTFKIALVADIAKMYRQIWVAPQDRKYQKILWRFSENEPVKIYTLNTVTFGTKTAPYLAIESTFKLAELEKDNFPEASKRVKTDFYVDDGLSGGDTPEEAAKLQRELDGLFSSGKMTLRKWASNDVSVLKNVPIENRANNMNFEINKNESIKTLGVYWTPKTDDLHFTIDMSKLSQSDRITKRKLLSDASKIFDPCGILSAITVKAKIMMQEIWKKGTDWDSLVHEEIQSEWNQYKKELPLIESIKLPRWLQTEKNSKIFLHGFCDSSERAYAAVIYLISVTKTKITSQIICAKTRVAPINSESIPRLELCGAEMLAKLMHRVSTNLNVDKQSTYLWTDSSIVLTWLRSHPSRWTTYVGNRVAAIQELYNASFWRHVRTHENPADIASRGVSASQLINNKLWFNGPDWLLLNEKYWPNLEIFVSPKINMEEKCHVNTITSVLNVPNEPELLTKFSDLNRLFRISARMFRFINQIKRRENLTYSRNIITPEEFERAKSYWIKTIQNLYFFNEISQLRSNKLINEKSSLRRLNPQLNDNELLIVHGRLQHSELSIARKFPIILPAKSYLSQLIIKNAHSETLHGTIHLTLAYVRNEYWILNARNLVKSHIHKCIECFRQNPQPMSQLMAPLPSIKTKPSRAFEHCGLDFAGPIEIKSGDKRNAPSIKSYICVFVCMASKAIHLELVGDLTTKKFILALRRMMARRGLCSNIYCDCGTNFQGAKNELPLLFLQAQSSVTEEISNLFLKDGIKFNFNPPSAPNWGGQWESYVKLTKHHLKRMNVSIKLTFEEMTTLLTQIEACVNSRPLCALTTDINDFDALTPGHLLIGAPLNLIPEPSLLELKNNTLDRFQAIQKGMQIFWNRFHTEYLHTLHPRKKWYRPNVDLFINDLVIIIEDNIPPAKWLMARVKEIHPSLDGHIRRVTLQTKNGEVHRPIVKICKLPIATQSIGPIDGGEDVPNRNKET